MNHPFGPATSTPEPRNPRPQPSRLGAWLVVIAACGCLVGCGGLLKPSGATARHYVLTPLPAAAATNPQPEALAVGVGPVKLASYLSNTSLAVRQGINEIEYFPLTLWAQRLDTGVQSVLAANLAALLPTDQIRLSSWHSQDVAVGVYVNIEQFDVDVGGRGVLVARWRILSPGGEKTLKSGGYRADRQGASPSEDSSGAVATLSGLLADFSRQLAEAIRESASPRDPVN